MGKLRNQKPLIIELLSLREMVYFVQRFLAQQKIMNAYVESIKD